MTQEDIKNVFHRIYKGEKNFMTPDIIKYGKRGKMVYEIASGESFCGGKLYGVTVIELPTKKRKDLSIAFSTLKDAELYVENDFSEVK